MNLQSIITNFNNDINLKLDNSEYYDLTLYQKNDSNFIPFNEFPIFDTLKINMEINSVSCDAPVLIYTNWNDNTNWVDNDLWLTNLFGNNNVDYWQNILNTGTTNYTKDELIIIDTITLVELNINSGYSNYNLTVPYNDFVNYFNTTGYTFSHIILNNMVFQMSINNTIHYFKINGYDGVIGNNIGLTNDELINLFDKTKFDCENNDCCNVQVLNIKPYAYQINNDFCTNTIKRRTEKGWTLMFKFNRENVIWYNKNIFYYLGVRGDDNPENYGDNNLSFGFDENGCITWQAIRYKFECNSGTTGYTETYYIDSGKTEQTNVNYSDDFDVTIIFERNIYLNNPDKNGGYLDMVQNVRTTTPFLDFVSGATPECTYDELLSQKWYESEEFRKGTLKIYLNGKLFYKIDNWVEIIPANRGVQPFIQSWGAGTENMNDIHNGACCFKIKNIKYIEEPISYMFIQNNIEPKNC
jgi:hypothetical protein